MSERRALALELNEVKWWSNWASLEWVNGGAYVITSRSFREQFFNRAGFLRCGAVSASVSAIEARFRSLGADPTILVSRECDKELAHLEGLGYKQVDSMSVMELGKPSFRLNESLDVSRANPTELRKWSRAYLLSFYGSTKLLPRVSAVTRKLRGKRDSILLMGTIGGRVAGVLAVQRSRGLAGVYCVGTVPKFRRMGVAGTLITAAAHVAEVEGRTLILQTLQSDHAEPFYAEGGFRRLYEKTILSRKLKTTPASEKIV